MIDIELAAIANQGLSIQLDGLFYEIDIREVNGAMAASITREGVPVVSNMRVTAGTPLLPYRYQESGNFVLLTDNEALPYWDQFGDTQFLVYVSPAELEAYRAGA